MEKKIGILTLYYQNHNMGGQLQARALVRAIEKLSEKKVEQIQFDWNRAWADQSKLTKMKKDARYRGGWVKKIEEYYTRRFREEKTYSDKTLVPLVEERFHIMNQFAWKTPHSESVYSTDTLKNALENYDVFICGGDQIWNDWGVNFYDCGLDAYTLSFVPQSVRKFSYAASIPAKNLNAAFAAKLSRGVKLLDAVAVREKSSVPLIENLTGRKVEVVVDPVLLLTREEWNRESAPVTTTEKYIVCYFLGEEVEPRQAAQKFADQIGARLRTFPHIVYPAQCDVGFGDIQDYTSGPAEFIGLIRNAEVVVTDSFHAAVFSMIYHKPFYVLERPTLVGGSDMGSRLTDFLSEYGLSVQKVTPEQLSEARKLPEIDYTYADQVLERRCAESYEYLKRNLKKKQ